MLNNRSISWGCHSPISWLTVCAGFLLFALLSMPVSANAAPDEKHLNGFLSARFGMSAEEVLAALKADGVQIDSDKPTSGGHQIRGQRKGRLATNKLIYLIPEQSKKLALVIEFYDSPDYHKQVLEDLREQLGDDLGAEIADMMIAQSGEKLPPGLKELTLWAVTAGDSNLLVRLMRFDNYLAVERIDTKLMSPE